MKRKRKLSDRLLILSRKIPDRQLMIILSIVVGFLAGMVAVIMKNQLASIPPGKLYIHLRFLNK